MNRIEDFVGDSIFWTLKLLDHSADADSPLFPKQKVRFEQRFDMKFLLPVMLLATDAQIFKIRVKLLNELSLFSFLCFFYNFLNSMEVVFC